MLEIRSLEKTYATGDHALKGVSFSISSGQIVALIGPSGAGKSSLIRCINKLVEPSAGDVILSGVNLTELRGKNLRHARRRIGMIFQEYALVERLTVMENVVSGRLGYLPFWTSLMRRYPADDVAQALELLERVGLSDHYEKRADELSGGQRQRVGIARALMQNPALLLVDEPTASLDPKTSRTIMRLICELVQERNLPAIINIHDVELAKRFADRIIGLQAGCLVFDGKPYELNDRVLSEIYGEEDWNAPARSVQTGSQGHDHVIEAAFAVEAACE